MNILSLVRENIKNLSPYSTARDEFKGIADVYLDANENPYPSDFNRYPDPLQQRLKTKISDLKSLPTDQIFLGNGSDEAIDLLIRTFCEPAREAILITEPTYGMYKVCADVNNVEVKKVKLTASYDIDVDVILSQLNDFVKIIFLCSPNNPTGNLLSKNKIVQLLERSNRIIVVDEAYIDFANNPGLTPILPSYPNLVLLQTFSKAWAMAGLRLGMAFASAEIISILNTIKYPYNINIVTQHIAFETLGQGHVKTNQVNEIIEQRKILSEKLLEIKCVQKIYPSDANFILVKMDNAKAIYDYMITKGIIVRDRSSVTLCEDCLRITIGTPVENERILSELKTL